MSKIKFWIAISLLVYSSCAEFTGDATEYTSGHTEADGLKGYACGFRWVSTKQRKFFAALPGPMWEGSLQCGRCAKVKCIDDGCDETAKKTETIIIIADKCPECQTGDLDFSKEAWNQITNNQSSGRRKISWDYVSCESLQDDKNLRMNVDPGANEWYFSANISNSPYGVKKARLSITGGDFVDLERREDNFWIKNLSPKLAYPYKLEVTDHAGTVTTVEFKEFVAGKTYEFENPTVVPGGDSSYVNYSLPILLSLFTILLF